MRYSIEAFSINKRQSRRKAWRKSATQATKLAEEWRQLFEYPVLIVITDERKVRNERGRTRERQSGTRDLVHGGATVHGVGRGGT